MANLPAPPKAGQSNAAPKGPQKYYSNINTGGPYPQTPVLTQQGFGMAPSIPTPPGGYTTDPGLGQGGYGVIPTPQGYGGGSIPMFGLGGGAPTPTGGRPEGQGIGQTFQYQTGVDPNTGLVIKPHPETTPSGFLTQSQQADVAGAQEQQALQATLEDLAAQRMEAQRQQQLALRMAGMGGSGLAGGAWGQVGSEYAQQAADERMQTGTAIETAKNNAATNATNYWTTKQTSHLAQHASEMDEAGDVQINPSLLEDMDKLIGLLREHGVSELAGISMIDDLFNQYQGMGMAHVYRKPGTSLLDPDNPYSTTAKAMNASGEMVQVQANKQYYKDQAGNLYETTKFDQGPTIDWS
jgi:hypothetical protein